MLQFFYAQNRVTFFLLTNKLRNCLQQKETLFLSRMINILFQTFRLSLLLKRQLFNAKCLNNPVSLKNPIHDDQWQKLFRSLFVIDFGAKSLHI